MQDDSNQPDDSTDLYKDPEKTPSGGLAKTIATKALKSGSKKALIGGAGAGLLALIIGLGGFFGFLNVFKLEHLMQNIEKKGFMRYQVSMDGRSSRWIQAYFTVRMAEVEDPNIKDPARRENLFFKSDKIRNNPMTDWYETLRTSDFEKDLYNKHGIMFTSIAERTSNGGVKFRTGKIRIKDVSTYINLSDSELRDLSNAFKLQDPSKLNSTLRQYIDFDKFDSDKSARRAIKVAVDGETKPWQVIKRRTVRKNIQNLIGVRNWRFFETTRNKMDEKKINIRNRVVQRMLPDSTRMGQFVQCFLGLATCKSSSDPLNPSNQQAPETIGDNTSNGRDNTKGVVSVNDTKNVPEGVSQAINEVTTAAEDKAASEAVGSTSKLGVWMGAKYAIMQTIISKINFTTAILSAVDMLAKIDEGISNGSLIKLVTAARAAQAVGLFTTYQTARDQIKTGEVTGPEVGQLMDTVNSVSNSEGWTSVMSNSKESAKAESSFVASKNKQEYCSPEHQTEIQDPSNHSAAEKEFAYLCGDKQIGGSSNATTITTWWTSTFGSTLSNIFSFYRHSGLDTLMGIINKATGWLTDYFVSPIVNFALKVTGLTDDVDSLFGWLTSQIVTNLGAGPMLSGTEPSGVFMNTLIQGSAYSGEASARAQGAAKTNKQTAALARSNTEAYLKETDKNQSIFNKYASLGNPDSALSKSLFATIQDSSVNNVVSVIGSIFKRLAMAPINLITARSVRATTDDPYAAANFAGIDTYDFPKQCYDLDPLTMQPADATNADDMGIIPANELTWDLLNNNTEFYKLVYEKIGNKSNADEIGMQVYDCGALDTAVRGGLGAMYGYTKDNGLDGYEASGVTN